MNETTTTTPAKSFDPLEPYGYPNIPANKTRRFTCKCNACRHKWTEDVEYKFLFWSQDTFRRHLPNWVAIEKTVRQCPDCGSRLVKADPIKGTYSATHKCDARCENATGKTCECQCGGANHGKGHLITTK